MSLNEQDRERPLTLQQQLDSVETEHVPTLIAEVRRLRGELTRIRTLVESPDKLRAESTYDLLHESLDCAFGPLPKAAPAQQASEPCSECEGFAPRLVEMGVWCGNKFHDGNGTGRRMNGLGGAVSSEAGHRTGSEEE